MKKLLSIFALLAFGATVNAAELTISDSMVLYPGQIPPEGLRVTCGAKPPPYPPTLPQISAERSIQPMLEFQCKDLRGMAHSAVEKEFEAAIYQAQDEFQRKCRAQGGGWRCSGPTSKFIFKADPKLYTVGSCTVRIFLD